MGSTSCAAPQPEPTGSTIDEPRFTDREVHEILKKAVEMGSSTSLAKREGLSLSELKAIGSEVGIDPARLEAAARLVARGGASEPHGLVGAPTVLRFERRVAGELDPTDTPEILSIIRRTMQAPGEVSEVGGALEWVMRRDAAGPYVTVSSKDGTVNIEVSANLKGTVTGMYVPAGIMGALLTFMGLAVNLDQADPSIIGFVLPLAVLPTAYLTVRALVRRMSRSKSAKLQSVVDELAQLVRGTEDQSVERDQVT